MADAPMNFRQRSAGLSIFLFIITLGIYWFIWMWTVFREIETDQNRPDIKTGTYVPILGGVYLVRFGLEIWAFSMLIGASLSAANFQQAFSAGYLFSGKGIGLIFVLSIITTLMGVAFYVIQLIYLKKATEVVAQAATGLGIPGAPQAVLPILFNVFFAAMVVPFVGSLLWIGAVVIAIIWVVQLQGTLNKYWVARASGAVPRSGVPSAPAMPPPAPTMKRVR
jgi:hypothetical protein